MADLLSIFNVLSYNPFLLILGTSFIIGIAVFANIILANFFEAQTNLESVYISALILALLITPPKSLTDMAFISLAFWATLFTMASKFIFTINKKHIWNPVAIALVITALVFNLPASWWVGTASMAPFVLVVGILIVRKTLRSDIVLAFLATAFVVIISSHFTDANSIFITTKKIILDTPLLFFSFIMLTEPLTMPPTNSLRISYGAIVGFLFAPFLHVGPIYSTPEIALALGNIFSYLVSPKDKLFLKLKDKKQITENIYDFIFEKKEPLKFQPGQYLEWTLGHQSADSRGNRRYFTIASSPTEKDIIIGVKFYDTGSSFKKAMLSLKQNDTIVASQLSGEFILPKDKTKKLVFIAGGIGITPFRSMLKYLIDTNENRDVVLIYSNRNSSDIAYKDILQEAEARLGTKIIYVITKEDKVSDSLNTYYGHITKDMISKYIPDFHERFFYISGTHEMVTSSEKTLIESGLNKTQILIDFFPGFV
jgi:ferredoxin-NADP reductase